MRRPAAVRVVGPEHWIGPPALCALLASVLLTTPMQLFGMKLPEPVFPMVLAFAWPLIRPSMIAPAALFALGVFLDLLWGGTLGIWPFCLMAVYAAVLLSRNLLAGQDTQVRFVWYAVCVSLSFLLAYLIVSMSAGNAPSLFALFGQWLPTLLLFPIANWMIERFDDGDTRFR